MHSSEKIYLYGLPGPREDILLCPLNIYLLGAEKGMNTNAGSHVCFVCGYSQEFTVNVGVHHYSVLI